MKLCTHEKSIQHCCCPYNNRSYSNHINNYFMKSNSELFLEEREENRNKFFYEGQSKAIKKVLYSKDRLEVTVVKKTKIPNLILCTLENIGL